MKTLIAIIVCLLGAFAVAADPANGLGDALDRAEASAQKTQAKLDQVTSQRDSYGRLLDLAADVSAKKDDTIKAKDTQITDLNTTIENGKKARVGLVSAGLGVPGGILTAVGIGACILGVIAVGLKFIGAGSLLVTESVTVALYAPQIGMVGLWLLVAGGALVLLGAALWVAYDVKNHKDAGIENGNLVPLAEASGKFTADQLATLEQLAHAEAGKLADKMRALARGVSVKELANRVRTALGIRQGAES